MRCMYTVQHLSIAIPQVQLRLRASCWPKQKELYCISMAILYHLYIVLRDFLLPIAKSGCRKNRLGRQPDSLTAKSRRSSASSIMAFSRPSCNTTAVGHPKIRGSHSGGIMKPTKLLFYLFFVYLCLPISWHSMMTHTRQEWIIIWSGRNWILKHAD